MPTNEKPGPEFNIGPWRHLLWVLALLGILHLFYSQGQQTAEPSYAISYSQFKSLIESGEVEKVVLTGEKASGQLFDDATLGPQGESGRRFSTRIPAFGDESLLPALEAKGVRIEVAEEGDGALAKTLLALLPWVIFIALWWWLIQRASRNMAGGGLGGRGQLQDFLRPPGTGLGGGHDEREQTLNQILAEMDGFAGHEAVIVLAATNRPDVLDPALLRPGRFDRHVIIDLPDSKDRMAILKVHARKVPIAKDVDFEKLAAGTPGFSGADIKNLVNEAAMFATRRKSTQVAMQDFDEARGQTLGGTHQIPEEERHTLPEDYLHDRPGDGGTASEIGPVDLRDSEEHPFLGREIAQPRRYSIEQCLGPAERKKSIEVVPH